MLETVLELVDIALCVVTFAVLCSIAEMLVEAFVKRLIAASSFVARLDMACSVDEREDVTNFGLPLSLVPGGGGMPIGGRHKRFSHTRLG